MTDHFKAAERALRQAEEAYDLALHGPIEESQANTLQAQYALSFASAHSVLAQVQAQRQGFSHVGEMAIVLEKDVNRKIANKEEK